MIRTPLLLALLPTALLSACCCGLPSDSAPVDVLYDADRSAYTPADSIVTRLENTSSADVGYNLCGAALERQSGGGWTRVMRTPEPTCAQSLQVLRPGESATYREPASAVPAPGTYRLRTRVEVPVSGPAKDVSTGYFTVSQ
ncbi:MAG TPA: hypothetical protein VGC13_14630 [Longimicrobium sp.]|jgi:hypothetical protein|uniref:hypothetical protein n=1 Tax=Longimicrobium sp. TaxID=2029185 RepID=UPI002ED7A598